MLPLSNEEKPVSREAERLRRYRERKKLIAAAIRDASHHVSTYLFN